MSVKFGRSAGSGKFMTSKSAAKSASKTLAGSALSQREKNSRVEKALSKASKSTGAFETKRAK